MVYAKSKKKLNDADTNQITSHSGWNFNGHHHPYTKTRADNSTLFMHITESFPIPYARQKNANNNKKKIA